MLYWICKYSLSTYMSIFLCLPFIKIGSYWLNSRLQIHKNIAWNIIWFNLSYIFPYIFPLSSQQFLSSWDTSFTEQKVECCWVSVAGRLLWEGPKVAWGNIWFEALFVWKRCHWREVCLNFCEGYCSDIFHWFQKKLNVVHRQKGFFVYNVQEDSQLLHYKISTHFLLPMTYWHLCFVFH